MHIGLKKNSDSILKIVKNKTILITGGAGSIGSHLAQELLKYPVSSVRVLDIDEYALFQLNRKSKNKKLRILLGNILDKGRVDMACENVDIIFHTAAIKNVEISEFNPIVLHLAPDLLQGFDITFVLSQSASKVDIIFLWMLR